MNDNNRGWWFAWLTFFSGFTTAIMFGVAVASKGEAQGWAGTGALFFTILTVLGGAALYNQ